MARSDSDPPRDMWRPADEMASLSEESLVVAFRLQYSGRMQLHPCDYGMAYPTAVHRRIDPGVDATDVVLLTHGRQAQTVRALLQAVEKKLRACFSTVQPAEFVLGDEKGLTMKTVRRMVAKASSGFKLVWELDGPLLRGGSVDGAIVELQDQSTTMPDAWSAALRRNMTKCIERRFDVLRRLLLRDATEEERGGLGLTPLPVEDLTARVKAACDRMMAGPRAPGLLAAEKFFAAAQLTMQRLQAHLWGDPGSSVRAPCTPMDAHDLRALRAVLAQATEFIEGRTWLRDVVLSSVEVRPAPPASRGYGPYPPRGVNGATAATTAWPTNWPPEWVTEAPWWLMPLAADDAPAAAAAAPPERLMAGLALGDGALAERVGAAARAARAGPDRRGLAEAERFYAALARGLPPLRRELASDAARASMEPAAWAHLHQDLAGVERMVAERAWVASVRFLPGEVLPPAPAAVAPAPARAGEADMMREVLLRVHAALGSERWAGAPRPGLEEAERHYAALAAEVAALRAEVEALVTRDAEGHQELRDRLDHAELKLADRWWLHLVELLPGEVRPRMPGLVFEGPYPARYTKERRLEQRWLATARGVEAGRLANGHGLYSASLGPMQTTKWTLLAGYAAVRAHYDTPAGRTYVPGTWLEGMHPDHAALSAERVRAGLAFYDAIVAAAVEAAHAQLSTAYFATTVRAVREALIEADYKYTSPTHGVKPMDAAAYRAVLAMGDADAFLRGSVHFHEQVGKLIAWEEAKEAKAAEDGRRRAEVEAAHAAERARERKRERAEREQSDRVADERRRPNFQGRPPGAE